MSDDDLQVTKRLLEDLFGRSREGVASLTASDDPSTAVYRPDDAANSIAWLLWHLTRIEDDHVSDLMQVPQLWTAAGWFERLDVPFDAADTGYGHSSDDVAAVRIGLPDVGAYYEEVHARTMDYVQSLTAAELDRVVDDRWDPPVTAAVRLVSVANDGLQHLGQAAYVRGLAKRAASH